MLIEHNSFRDSWKVDRDMMHLPMHVALPDGRHVTIDTMTDSQMSNMYKLIVAAAINGHGFGVDEYPTEKDFRREVDGYPSFVLCGKECGKLIAAFSLVDSKFYRGTENKVVDPIIIVKKSERGKGIGDFIFRQVVHFSKRLGFTGIYTDTFNNNHAMMKIIERYPGFQRVGHFPMSGKMPDGTLVGANLYFKDLRNTGEDNTLG